MKKRRRRLSRLSLLENKFLGLYGKEPTTSELQQFKASYKNRDDLRRG